MPWLTSAEVVYVDKSGGNFRLLKDLVYMDGEGKRWVTPAGFTSDLNSIPRGCRWLVKVSCLGKTPFLHDLNYRQNPYKITREQADDLYFNGAVDEGMARWKAKLMFYGLRLGGRFSWKGK